MKIYHNLKLSHHNTTVLVWRIKSERPYGFERNWYFRSYSICAADLWILPQMPAQHWTTSHCTSCREGRCLSQRTISRPPRSQICLLVNTRKYLQHSHDQFVPCSKGGFFTHSFLLRCLLYPSPGLNFYSAFFFTVFVP